MFSPLFPFTLHPDQFYRSVSTPSSLQHPPFPFSLLAAFTLLPPPPFISRVCSLTAGSDYGREKWGSHANNPPLQHSCSMTPHFLPTGVRPALPPFLLLFFLSCFCRFSSVLCSKEGGPVCARGGLSRGFVRCFLASSI